MTDPLIPFFFFLVTLVLCWLARPLFHLQGSLLVVVRILLLVLGVSATAALYMLQRKKSSTGSSGQPSSESDPAASLELNTQLRDAEHRLAASQRASSRSLGSAPVFYLMGEANAAKTTTALYSGLDPELLAGQVFRDSSVIPTQLANFWYTEHGVLIEAGVAVRNSPRLWEKLVRRTRPHLFRSALGAETPVRAAIVCVSCESFFGPAAAQSLQTLARASNERLRTLSRQLGIELPVYVVFTKLDRVSGFAEFVRHLTTEEISDPLGVALPRTGNTQGLYAEQATTRISAALDQLFFTIGEFRIEALARESEQRLTAPVYQFPRELQKLRNSLTSYLVELARPTHLSAKPYLRGFFFTGVRAHASEQPVSTPAPNRQQAKFESDATRILSLRSHSEEPSTPIPQVMTHRIAQFCFLPRLFKQAVLGDSEALTETQSRQQVRWVKRTVLATAAAALIVWIAGLTVSYHNNLELERSIQADAADLPAGSAVLTLAPASDLQPLDHLRSILLRLEDYDANGAPLSLRWGLYRGHAVLGPARSLYFERFQRLLLTRTQQNLVASLSALPPVSPPEADYLASYNPLRAYLITTSYPDHSTIEFLPPALVAAWLNNARPASDEQLALADRQFHFYSKELLVRPPYNLQPENTAITRARIYLNSFGGLERVYRNILDAANQSTPAIDFNRLYPGSASTVIESHVVSGSFTRAGFDKVSQATNHPERYFTGESWVLGDTNASTLQAATLSQQLHDRYARDYITEWRTYLHSASVVHYHSLADARQKLESLSSPNSALLALVFVASQNTAVAEPGIAGPFQPAQALVSPDSPARLIGAGNSNYINGLVGLGSALSQFTQNPSAQTDPNAAQSVIASAVIAHGDVSQTAQSFNIDPDGHVETTITSLLQEPIASVESSVRDLGPQQLKGASRGLCNSLAAISNKYPFSRGSTIEATPAEVTALLKPGTGALWQFYDASLKTLITQQGDTWVASPSAPAKLNPAFLQFFRRLSGLSAALFPSGAATPSLTFSLHILPAKEINSVTVAVDAQRLTGSNVSKSFTWSAQTAQSSDLIASYGSGSLPLHFSGTWALFHLIDRGRLQQGANPVRLAYPLEIANTPIVINGTPLTEGIELSGTGSALLVPGSLNGLHCPAQITK